MGGSRKKLIMVYRVMGIMSGSSLDGLDIAFVQFTEQAKHWQFEILKAECRPFPDEWKARLRDAVTLNARDHALLDHDFGHYIGHEVNRFIEHHSLEYNVALIASHGHTTFHLPPRATVQVGHGAAIAAETGLPVVSELRAVDVALGGQGAPIVPMGERLLWKDVPMFLNLGGIANISINTSGAYIAYDVCPANRVLNMLSAKAGKEYDDGGRLAAAGAVSESLLAAMDALPYYHQPYPKSLANDFGTDVVYPILDAAGGRTEDLLRTFTEHVARQVSAAVEQHAHELGESPSLMVTGGGAFNSFLVARLCDLLAPLRVRVELPDPDIIQYKEALIMGLLGVLRWRDEPTTLASVTGASRDSIGGAIWNAGS